MAALIGAGCTTASRISVAKDGTQTTSKVSTFLTTASGFSDTVSTPDGLVSQTTLNNYASDVQAINAIFSGMQNLGQLIVLAQGGTNVSPVVVSNLFAAQLKSNHK